MVRTARRQNHLLSKVVITLFLFYLLFFVSLVRLNVQASWEDRGYVPPPASERIAGVFTHWGNRLSNVLRKISIYLFSDADGNYMFASSNGGGYIESIEDDGQHVYKTVVLRRLTEKELDGYEPVPSSDEDDNDPLPRHKRSVRALHASEPEEFYKQGSETEGDATYDAKFNSFPTNILRSEGDNIIELDEHIIKGDDKRLFLPRKNITQINVDFQSLGEHFYVYGVYFDDRYAPKNYLRILVLRKAETDQMDLSDEADLSFGFQKPGSLWCKFDTETGHQEFASNMNPAEDNRERTVNVIAQPYEMCENHERPFGGWFYSCLVPHSLVNLTSTSPTFPTKVTLSRFGNIRKRNQNVKSTLTDVPIQPLRHITPTGSSESLTEPMPTKRINEWRSKLSELLFHTKSQFVQNPGNEYVRSEQEPFLSRKVKGDGKNKNVQHYTINKEHAVDQRSGTASTDGHAEPTKRSQDSHNTNAVNAKNRIGVCVPPLYGQIPLSKIINFIEMCNLLGSSKVFLYVQDIHDSVTNFLASYPGSNPNILTLVHWNIPILKRQYQEDPNKTIDESHEPWFAQSTRSRAESVVWQRAQIMAVQHCLYSNMADFDWLLFMDLDELLVPKNAFTWPDLIQQVLNGTSNLPTAAVMDQVKEQDGTKHRINIYPESLDKLQPEDVAGFSFQSAFFQNNNFQMESLSTIDYFRLRHRTRQTSLRRSKMMVRPTKVFEMGIHHLSRPVEYYKHGDSVVDKDITNSKNTPKVLNIPASVALLHHYRDCVDDPDNVESIPNFRGDSTLLFNENYVSGNDPLDERTEDDSELNEDNIRSKFDCDMRVRDETMLKYQSLLGDASEYVTSRAVEYFGSKR